MKAVIDTNKCAVQKDICNPFSECPQKAIMYIEDEDLPLGCKIEILAEKCIGCGHCATVCCGHCIELQ